ncbi:DUF397 domain-containing protein [Actinomadura kijaniata]|uniref:DUF397 domain-containing protein n=1 Tax=Actinomadura kijaniata TaxID=46161 RepID=UPI003F198BAC
MKQDVLTWRKASASGENGGDCIELASAANTIAIRDSKDPDGPRLVVERDGFHRAAAAIKNTP